MKNLNIQKIIWQINYFLNKQKNIQTLKNIFKIISKNSINFYKKYKIFKNKQIQIN